MMTQNEIDLDWSHRTALSIVEDLIVGKVLAEADAERAIAIAAQMIHIPLVSGDRPEATARYYRNKS
jgi:hypothetical protein